jgi:hypothetical protein
MGLKINRAKLLSFKDLYQIIYITAMNFVIPLFFLQSSNFAAILCGVCHTLLKPLSKAGAGGKKSKKRKEISDETVSWLVS